jgi:type-F conjugative transfer system secretin TraK
MILRTFNHMFLGIVMGVILVTPIEAKKHRFVMTEDEPLVVQVNQHGAIRIHVQGDRIQEVMGLEESVTFDKDETHGVLYMRGVDKKQTVTITTEGGAFQDVTLEPSEGGVSHIVLVPSTKGKELQEVEAGQNISQAPLSSLPQTSSPNQPFQDSVLGVIKQLYQGVGDVVGLYEYSLRQTTAGVLAKPLRILISHGMKGVLFEVRNKTGTTQNLLEKDFYHVGDYALALGKRQLEAGQVTTLVVVGG